MAAIHGSKARIAFGALDVSPWLRDARLAGAVAVAEKTTFTSPAKEWAAGQSSRDATFEGLYDKDLTIVRDALGSATEGVLTYAPGGWSTTTDLAWLASVIEAQYDESAPIGDMVAFAWGATASGQVAFGTVLHPFGEDTNTTVGTSRDDGAQTTTGWVAHLHVSAVDGGSWVVKLEDSANNSAWSDVTGGAFTAATTATSQRLSSASGATLRRYLRYSATRTSGSSGDGITFLLAVSRLYAP